MNREDSRIYISCSNYISEISNGTIKTIAGLNPLAKTLSPVLLMRDSAKKINYFIDNYRVLKKFDEKTGKSISLSWFLLPSIPVFDFPYLTITMSILGLKTFGKLSKFDNKIYIKETCRIIRLDPETMNYERVIGSACGAFVPNVKGTLSPCPPNAMSGFTIDESNGDLLISDILHIYRYSLENSTTKSGIYIQFLKSNFY